jgi:murein DD-endopeptidase MepM/ murein hydrolase activator NlpD
MKSLISPTVIPVVALLLFIRCFPQDSNQNEVALVLATEYVLPFPVGNEYLVTQANNSPWSHSATAFNGVFRYAYDFDMPVGTILTAAREGTVVYIVDNYTDGDVTLGHENVLVINHGDGTYSRYIHIKKQGALVTVGTTVQKGDTIALSGNTGYTLNQPHLHFDVIEPAPGQLPDITSQSIFVSFRNSSAFPNALDQGKRAKALNYTTN